MISCDNVVLPPLNTINQLEVDGAILPVHIYGPEESATAIIVVHGGPGESAVLKREAIGFYRLESQFRIIYYDQRGAGIGEGNTPVSSMTVEQMASDLAAVVELVEAGTRARNIFIVSLDWGAAVAVEFLTSGSVSSSVRGYVAVDPGFNAMRSMERSRDELIDLASELLHDNTPANDPPAQNLLDFYEANPVINRFNYEEHYRLLENIGGIIVNINHGVSGVSEPAYVHTLTEHNLRFSLEHWTYNGSHFLQGLDVDPDLGDIAVPVKLIWGAFDRLMPVSLALEYSDAFGPASSDELLSIFPASANRPYLEEGDRFFATVATWVDFYN